MGRRWTWVLLGGLLVTAAWGQGLDNERAFALARADESSLQGDDARQLHDAEVDFVGSAVASCRVEAPPAPGDTAFSVVAQLDEAGIASRTWRHGDSPLARCFERHLMGSHVYTPPRAPFYVYVTMH